MTDNHGHARWMTMREAQRLFPGPAPGYGGVVVGEAYRVDQDNDDRFDPKDRSTWGKGGRAPLLIDDCTSGPGHSLLFAGSGGFKTVSAVVSTLLGWTGSSVALDPSREVGPMLRTTLGGHPREDRPLPRHREARRRGAVGLQCVGLDQHQRGAKKPEEDIYAVVSWMFGGSGQGEFGRPVLHPVREGAGGVPCLLTFFGMTPPWRPKHWLRSAAASRRPSPK